MFIDVLTAIVGVGITATVPVCQKKEAPASLSPDKGSNSYLTEIKYGFLYLKENRFLRRLLLFQITILFLISPSAFLTPLMVSRTFGAEVWRLTASEMTYSLGMVLGGLLIASWGGFRKKINTTLAAGAAYGLLMVGLGIAPAFLVYLICNTMIGITSPCYNTPVTVTIQETVPANMHGRIFSFMQIATSCALPLGMTVFGPVADFIPIQWILIGAGMIVTVISLSAHRLLH